jgi:hypothetical protein
MGHWRRILLFSLHWLLGQLRQLARGIGDLERVVGWRTGGERRGRAGIAEVPTRGKAGRGGRGAFRRRVETRVSQRMHRGREIVGLERTPRGFAGSDKLGEDEGFHFAHARGESRKRSWTWIFGEASWSRIPSLRTDSRRAQLQDVGRLRCCRVFLSGTAWRVARVLEGATTEAST